MIKDLANFIETTVKRGSLQRLQRWVISTRAKSYNAVVLFNVWIDGDKDRQTFVDALIANQKPETAGISVSLKEALICVADSSDVEKFVCTTGLEAWCIRVHCTMIGNPYVTIGGESIKMDAGFAVKIPFASNGLEITPVYNSQVVQLVTFWGTDKMPKIWDITR